MDHPPPSSQESDRLDALARYQVVDTPPEALYDDITTLARDIAATPIALISFVDRDRQWFKSNVGLEGITETPREGAFCGHAIARREAMIVPDTLLDMRFRDSPLVQGEPRLRFYAGIPLVDGAGFALGTLCVADRQPRTLAPEQIDHLCRLRDIVVAMLEARADRDELRQVRERLGKSEQQLRDMIDAVPILIGYLDREQRYVFVNRAAEKWFGVRAQGIIGHTMEEMMGPEAHGRVAGPFQRALAGHTVTFENRTTGFYGRYLQVTFVPDRQSDGVRGVYAMVSDISSRVHEEVHRHNEDLRAMAARLRQDVEAERKRIAYALHDEMGQDLTALRLHAARLVSHVAADPELSRVAHQIEHILSEAGAAMRRIVAGLRPLALDSVGIAGAARELGREVEESSGIAVDLTVEGDFAGVPETHQTALYRLLQESFNNAVKHAEATELHVLLAATDDQLELTVRDNGRGFDVQATPGRSALGLLGMRESAAQLGGRAAIESAPGKGTTLRIVLPLFADPEGADEGLGVWPKGVAP